MPLVDIPFHEVGNSNYLYFFFNEKQNESILFSLKVIVDGEWNILILWIFLSFGYDVRVLVYFSLLWEVVVKKPVVWVLISYPWMNLLENLKTDSWMSLESSCYFWIPLPQLLSKPPLHFSWTVVVALLTAPLLTLFLLPCGSFHPPQTLRRANPMLEPHSPHRGLWSICLGSRLPLTLLQPPCFAVAGM